MSDRLLRVEDLKVTFGSGRTLLGNPRVTFDAVRGVSFHVERAKTFGLVGESGSGKSTTGRAILRLEQPSGGQIWYENHEVTAMAKRTPMWYRRAVQAVYQDPLSSLNPSQTIDEIVGRAVIQGSDQSDDVDVRRRVTETLERVGLGGHHRSRLPRELSGGQRQRVAIARAIAVNPTLIVCDEAVSALDVSTQSQVINLLEDLQRDFGVAYLFIAHDLSVVRHVSDRLGVMYLGLLMEEGPAEEVYRNPGHPYTKTLLQAIPVPDPARQRRRRSNRSGGLIDEPPNPITPPSGCVFHPRCPEVMDVCRTVAPPLRELGDRRYLCHLPPEQTLELPTSSSNAGSGEDDGRDSGDGHDSPTTP